jgi:hypothetical protein
VFARLEAQGYPRERQEVSNMASLQRLCLYLMHAYATCAPSVGCENSEHHVSASQWLLVKYLTHKKWDICLCCAVLCSFGVSTGTSNCTRHWTCSTESAWRASTKPCQR